MAGSAGHSGGMMGGGMPMPPMPPGLQQIMGLFSQLGGSGGGMPQGGATTGAMKGGQQGHQMPQQDLTSWVKAFKAMG